MAWLDRLLQKRQGLDAITGYAGGSLQDQLDADAQPDNPSATRPRIVNPFVSRLLNQPAPAQPEQPVSTDVQVNRDEPPMLPTIPLQTDTATAPVTPDQTTRPRVVNPNPFLDRLMNNPSMQERPRETNPPDAITKDVDYLNQLQAQPDRFRDKLGLVAQSISRNLGGQPLPTRKQHEEEKATEALQRDLAVQRQQILNQQGMMVPVYDKDGNIIGQAPARTAAGTQIRASSQSSRQQRIDELGTSDALGRYNSMKVYKPGENDALDNYFARYFPGGLPEKDEEKDKETYDIRMINGQLIRTPRHSGPAQVVPGAPVDPTQVPVPVQGPQGQVMVKPGTAATITAGNTRQQQSSAAAEKRQQERIATKPQRSTDSRLMKMIDGYNEARGKEMSTDIRASDKKQFTQKRTGLWNAIFSAYPGMVEADENGNLRLKAQVAPAQSLQSTPSGGGSFNLGAWKQDHPNATDAQIQAQRAKAEARKLAIVE
jgi:hypothetical protein